MVECMVIPERLERGGLLIVETEANGVSKSTNERVLPCWFVGFVQETFALPWLFSRPSTKYFSLTVHYFNSFVPFALQTGHAVVQGRLSLNTCLWSLPFLFINVQLKAWERGKQ